MKETTFLLSFATLICFVIAMGLSPFIHVNYTNSFETIGTVIKSYRDDGSSFYMIGEVATSDDYCDSVAIFEYNSDKTCKYSKSYSDCKEASEHLYPIGYNCTIYVQGKDCYMSKNSVYDEKHDDILKTFQVFLVFGCISLFILICDILKKDENDLSPRIITSGNDRHQFIELVDQV